MASKTTRFMSNQDVYTKVFEQLVITSGDNPRPTNLINQNYKACFQR